MASFDVYSPEKVSDLMEYIKNAPANTKYLAGGTDLVIHIREKKVSPELVIDLSRINELQYIKEEENEIKIGAVTSFTTIEESPVIQKYAFCLAQAASGVGSVQIRNTGTIGGNVANASPAADSIPALVALGANLKIEGPEGSRMEKIEDFLVGVEKTILKPREYISEITIPKYGEGYKSGFAKLGRRKALAIARINLAVIVKLEGHIVKEMRIGLGAVGTTAYRPYAAEKALEGKKLDNALIEEMAELLSKVVEEKIGARASMPYKRAAIKGLVFDVGELLLK
ncbi:FAD binding domain-containing protein [Desulfitibacter alkalitolerans]|uniref:FAD binding domain-containing protein n=1 Tax=Desulfitibacter alkalitolerans TaxID=264641 RepID=UPI0004801CFC|nr:xanthine dehydrogenase family protein subunit M [Desulfitibacter alkalitolerans]